MYGMYRDDRWNQQYDQRWPGGSPADTASQWTERLMGSIAQVQEQSGDTPGALMTLFKVLINRVQSGRG